MSVTVRRAVAKDYEVIGRLLCDLLKQHQSGRSDLFEPQSDGSGKYTKEEFEAELADDRTVVFTACTDGRIVGYIVCKLITVRKNPVLKNVKTLYIDDLCVDESSRGTGAGRMLMEAAESYAKEIGCHNITLNVWEFNGSAKAFYEHLGYGTQRREMEKVLE